MNLESGNADIPILAAESKKMVVLGCLLDGPSEQNASRSGIKEKIHDLLEEAYFGGFTKTN